MHIAWRQKATTCRLLILHAVSAWQLQAVRHRVSYWQWQSVLCQGCHPIRGRICRYSAATVSVGLCSMSISLFLSAGVCSYLPLSVFFAFVLVFTISLPVSLSSLSLFHTSLQVGNPNKELLLSRFLSSLRSTQCCFESDGYFYSHRSS